MINAIAVDDEPPALQLIKKFCDATDFIKLQKVFTRPDEALKYLKAFPVDLLFLDINMPSVSGLKFADKMDYEPMIIFTTAFSEYAVEGFELNAVDYLLKPFSFERFQKAAEKARDFFQFQQKSKTSELSYIFVRADYKLIRIQLKDILFIEGLDDYVKINVLNQSPIVVRMTMKSIHEKLPESEFIRVHRSFIVPLHHIKSIKNKKIRLDSADIPIGSSYEKEINTLFKSIQEGKS